MKILIFLTLILSSFSSSIWANICGLEDDRIISNDLRVGRLMLNREGANGLETMNCTITMVSNSCAITAGHCLDFTRLRKEVEFKVPRSTRFGVRVSSDKYNRYYIDDSDSTYKVQAENRKDNILKSDWAVIKIKPNRKTGKYPGQQYGYFEMNTNPNDININDKISSISYGTLSRFDKNKSFGSTQRMAYGSLKNIFTAKTIQEFFMHDIDTMPGSSGAAILNSRDEVIGIHSAGGCKERSGYNSGTLLFQSLEFLNAIRNCIASESF